MSKNPLRQLIVATKTVLTQGRSYQVWFLVLMVVVYAIYILLPVWLIAGNSIAFQLSILTIRDYILFTFLSVAIALLITMQAFLFMQSKKSQEKVSAIGQGSIGASSALFGGLLATAACSSCIAVILGFLGAGSVFFVLENQLYVVIGAFMLVLVGLYFTIRRVNGYCENCEVPTQKK